MAITEHALPTMTGLLARLEQRRPQGPFLLGESNGMNGRAFAHAVQSLAGGFAAHTDPGDRILLHLEKGVDLVVALWAAAIAGCIAVPVHPRSRDRQVTHVLTDAEPALVVTSPTRELLLVDPDGIWGARPTFGRREGPGLDDLRRADDGALRSRQPSPDTPCIFLYSSGSTGAPKAIVQTHRTLVDGARVVAGYLDTGPDDVVLALLPLSFDYGLNQVLSAAWAGAQVVLADYLGAADLVRRVAARRVTVLAGVPTLWHDLAGYLTATPEAAGELAPLRTLTNSGGRLDPRDVARLRQALPRARFHSMYGLTEAFRSTSLDPAEIDAHPDSIGRPVAGVDVVLVDPGGNVVEGAGTGELVHSGAFVGPGYWRRPADTAARFRPHPLHPDRPAVWSGDIVRRDRAGRLYFVGRNDDQLKVDGYRVSPDEVAEALRSGLDLDDVAVVGIDGGSHGHRLVAFVQGAGDPCPAIRAWARRHLPPHLQPADVHGLERFPRTAHGKVDRVALRALAIERASG